MSGDDHRITRTSYDAGAEAFRERTRDRSRVGPYVDLFADALDRTGRVLDAGCGPGHDRVLLEDRGLHVISMDLSHSMLTLARETSAGPLVQGDLRALPFRGPVDGVWANASLLHVPREFAPAAVGRMVAALRPHGALLVTLKKGEGQGVMDPTYQGMGPRWFTYWDDAGLDALLRDAGCTIQTAFTNPSSRGGNDHDWLVRLARRSA